jgi:hypothetical protein
VYFECRHRKHNTNLYAEMTWNERLENNIYYTDLQEIPIVRLDGNGSNQVSVGGFCATDLLPTVLQLFVGPWPLFNFLSFYTVGRTSWTGN